MVLPLLTGALSSLPGVLGDSDEPAPVAAPAPENRTSAKNANKSKGGNAKQVIKIGGGKGGGSASESEQATGLLLGQAALGGLPPGIITIAVVGVLLLMFLAIIATIIT